MDNKQQSVQQYRFDGAFLLYQTESRRLYSLNRSGEFIWLLYQKNKHPEYIGNQVARKFDISPCRACHDVNNIISSWREAGLVECFTTKTEDSSPPLVFDDPTRQEILVQHCPSTEHRIFRIACLNARLVCDNQGIMAELENILGHLRRPEHEPFAFTLTVSEIKNRYLVAVNEITLHTCTTRNDLLAWVLFELIGQSYRKQDCLAVLHAGAVSHDGAAVLFPGSGGSGKSTLVAALQCLDFAYLSDDVCPLTSPEGRLIPAPMSQGLKDKSWPLMENFHPSLATQPEWNIFGRPLKFLRPPTGDLASWNKTWPVKAFIFPKYLAGAPFMHQRLSPFQVLSELIETSSLFGENIPLFLGWLAKIPAYSIRYSDLNEAIQWIKKICSETTPAINEKAIRLSGIETPDVQINYQ